MRSPERCATAARLLDGGDDLAVSLERLLADVGAPMRLRELGYDEHERARSSRERSTSGGSSSGHRRRSARRSSRRCSGRRCEDLWPGRVAIVGAGTMGVGICAGVRLECTIPTVARRQHARAERGRAESAPSSSSLGSRRQGSRRRRSRDGAAEPFGCSLGRGGVDDADLIIEAVVERPDVKPRSTRRSSAAAADGAVIATNTSSIPISELADGLRRPARFLGMHWFVPPLLVPCVEVIPAPDTRRAGRA